MNETQKVTKSEDTGEVELVLRKWMSVLLIRRDLLGLPVRQFYASIIMMESSEEKYRGSMYGENR